MPASAKCTSLNSGKKFYELLFDKGLATKYRISLIPINLVRFSVSNWHKELLNDLFARGNLLY